MAWFFLFFLISGFCSLVDEVVWLRLARAAFGMTTPFVSIVLSIFMGGLALGSWGAGKLVRRLRSGPAPPLRVYALAELIIGFSALTVPVGLQWGRTFMERGGGGVEWASSSYYLASGAWMALILLPFTTAMGATFPLAMAALRQRKSAAFPRSFSLLYLANVLGAASGTLVSGYFLIELLGFRHTLHAVAAFNAAVAATAFAWSFRVRTTPQAPTPQEPAQAKPVTTTAVPPQAIPWLLFATGAISMGMEVVWVRLYTPYLGTVVYSFAIILAVYLFATFVGSTAYRRWVRSRVLDQSDTVWLHACILLGLLAVIPLAAVDPRLPLFWGPFPLLPNVALGLGPFCAALGFVTPMLVDRWSGGDPGRAGGVYAVNIVGCILGPLVAGFLLLPALGERLSLIALAVPLFATGFLATLRPRALLGRSGPRVRMVWFLGTIAAATGIVLVARDYETMLPRRETRRDYSATVIAFGEGMERRLMVNGIGMTILTPITKMMVHLPLAFLPRPPQNSLVICFGMGTSFRSALSWGIPCTAVELIPSVPKLFGYYHADAEDVVRAPGARIVVDDGRRFLARDQTHYDLITVDPPPPVEAAGSSLLYSKEFYALASSRLSPDGILAAWFPGGEQAILCSVAKAVAESFPYVRVFQSMEGRGFHFLASNRPIGMIPPAQLAARLPVRAAADLVEWSPGKKPEELFEDTLRRELHLEQMIGSVPGTPTLVDDRPVNEYYFVRRHFGPARRR